MGLRIGIDMGTTNIHLVALGNEAEISEASFPDTVSHSGHCNSGDRSELFVFSAYLRIKTFPLDAGKRLLRDYSHFAPSVVHRVEITGSATKYLAAILSQEPLDAKRTLERSVAHASPDTRSVFHMSCAI